MNMANISSTLTTGYGGASEYPLNISQSQSKSAQCYQCLNKLSADQIKRCGRCKTAIYCGQACQKEHWQLHKQGCTPKQQETTHVALQKMNLNASNMKKKISTDFVKRYTDENAIIRQSFTKYDTQIQSKALNQIPPQLRPFKSQAYHHAFLTQEFILKGGKHLDPQKSVVLVCGAQCYDGKFVEPLPELLLKCKKMILIDIDPDTLQQLSSVLKSPKVSTMTLDLTNSLSDLESFEKEVRQNQFTPSQFINKMQLWIEKLIDDTQSRTAGLGALESEESADYVISSLVGSQLFTKVKMQFFHLFEEQFHAPISSVINPSQWFNLINTGMEALINKHIDDLLAWAGVSGIVYFADSITLKHQNLSVPIVSSSCVEKIELHLKEKREKVEERNWHWMENLNSIYDVKALLCSNTIS
jgi:hypothetical protein